MVVVRDNAASLMAPSEATDRRRVDKSKRRHDGEPWSLSECTLLAPSAVVGDRPNHMISVSVALGRIARSG